MKKEIDFKVDIVLPWVNPQDPEWFKERKKIGDDIIVSDYRDWGLLKYVFRSIEKYAPWVNKVYLITWGHLPSFLNLDNEKLVIVNHKDYIPEKYLPTFSSHVLELNMHRIKGLSEHFIYFNDDLFFVNPTKKTDFFSKDGLPLDSAIINPVAPARYDTICNVMVNMIGIINEHFNKRNVMYKNIFKWYNYKYGVYNFLNLIFAPWGKFPGLLQQHLPASFLKSTFTKVWEQENQILDMTCTHKIRNFKTDVNQYLMKEWQIAEGNFAPRSTKIGDRFLIETKDDAYNAVKYMKKSFPKVVCLNDHLKSNDEKEINEIIDILKNTLEEKLNEKSEFEI